VRELVRVRLEEAGRFLERAAAQRARAQARMSMSVGSWKRALRLERAYVFRARRYRRGALRLLSTATQGA